MPVMTGGVRSTLIVTVADAVRPAPFFAEQVMSTPDVSLDKVTGSQPVALAIPDSGSATCHVMVTSLTYHASPPGVPATIGTITGEVVSTSSFVTRRGDAPTDEADQMSDAASPALCPERLNTNIVPEPQRGSRSAAPSGVVTGCSPDPSGWTIHRPWVLLRSDAKRIPGAPQSGFQSCKLPPVICWPPDPS